MECDFEHDMMHHHGHGRHDCMDMESSPSLVMSSGGHSNVLWNKVKSIIKSFVGTPQEGATYNTLYGAIESIGTNGTNATIPDDVVRESQRGNVESYARSAKESSAALLDIFSGISKADVTNELNSL